MTDGPLVDRTCQSCGSSFQAPLRRVRAGTAGLYCSRACAEEERTCVICHATFTTQFNSKKCTCSASCRLKIATPGREPLTYVATSELAPFVAAAIKASSVSAFSERVALRDAALSDAGNAARALRRILDLETPLTPHSRADSILLAAGLNINQAPLATLPGSSTAAELMLATHAELRGETLKASERRAQAVTLLRFSEGYLAGLTESALHADVDQPLEAVTAA